MIQELGLRIGTGILGVILMAYGIYNMHLAMKKYKEAKIK